MGTVIFHVGTHKTGSSSIQSSLHTGIKDANYVYLDLGRVNHSGPITQICMHDPSRYHANRKLGMSKQESLLQKQQYLDRLLKALQDLDGKIGVISAEDAWALPEEALEYIRETIRSYGHSIRVLAYVRPPKSYIESAFQQRVKAGQGTFEPDRAYPRYQRLLTILKVFRGYQCDFIAFKRDRLRKNDVVIDFCSRIGLNSTSITVKHENESVSLLSLKLLYSYRAKYGPEKARSDAIARSQLMVKIARKFACEQRLAFDNAILEDYLRTRGNDVLAYKRVMGEDADDLIKGELLDEVGNVRNEGDLLGLSPSEVSLLNAELAHLLPNYRPKASNSTYDYCQDLNTLLETYWQERHASRSRRIQP